MKLTYLTRILSGAACLALLPVTVAAQDELDPAKMAEVMAKYGSPGPEHKLLRSWVGTWKVESKYWMAPDGKPMTSSGESKCRMLLKGRYLSEHFSAESPEMGKLEGWGTMAYDRLEQEFVQTWIDSMSTGMMVSRGKLSGDGSTIEMHNEQKCPMTMQMLKHRFVSHIKDPKRHKLEMFVTYPGKPEFKSMEIIYTKVEGAAKRGKKKE